MYSLEANQNQDAYPSATLDVQSQSGVLGPQAYATAVMMLLDVVVPMYNFRESCRDSRQRIRLGQYLLQEDPCHDCLVHWCCEPCALCQEYRELKNRGFDMSLGWDGNVERQTRGVTTLPPAVNGGMGH